VYAGDEQEIALAFATIAERRLGALSILADPSLANRHGQIVASASRLSLPTIYSHRQYVAAGGLISYGTDPQDVFRQVGVYATKFLQGVSPADLPVTLPTKFELVI
jgi:putative tryptophan/tyrosine transport system substrate-binding protein